MAWYNTDNLELLYAPHKRDWRAEAFKKIKKVAIDVAKRSAVFRKASRRILLDERMGGYQKRTAHIATDPKVVLFSTFDGRGYSDSPKAIYEYMCSDPRFADYTFVWAFREPKKFTYVLDHPNTYMVTVNTPAYEEACARAKYWFFNYRIADHIYPKEDQVYVQLWHGTPLKRLGYDISISDNAMNSKEEIRQKYKVDAEKFKYILAPSAFAAEKFISAWNLQAVGKALPSTLLSMFREVVFGVGFALLLPVFFGLDGVLYSMPVSDILTFIISAIIIVKTYRELNVEGVQNA